MNDQKDLAYWVWLQRAAGKGANLERLLTPFGGDVRALYEANPRDREHLLLETPSEMDGLEAVEARAAGMDILRNFDRGEQRRVMREARRQNPDVTQLDLFGEPADRSARRSFRKRRRPIAPSTLEKMKRVSLAEAEEVLELCERTGIRAICPEDEHYPWLLREVPTLPAVLYALGDVELLSPRTLPFAMVGARDARLSSLSAASKLAGALARSGLLIVSGGAIGTDSACHIGALNAGCPTVAVLGTGIGTNYLQQNADLRRVIANNGLLLSEMEPGEPGSRGSFPMRNRIIAGMSIGTLVVEAAVKSGSLITSKFAEEYDRDVFVPLFPGIDPERPLRSPSLRGTRELLERETGVGIRCAADILVNYAGSYGVNLTELVASNLVSEECLTQDITDMAGVFPPLLSPAMVAKARAQIGTVDLAGEGTLNPNPGWGPYRTAEDAELRTYTSAEFAYRRGDHPYENGDVRVSQSNRASDDTQVSGVNQAFDSNQAFFSHKPCNVSPIPSTYSQPLKPFKDLSSAAKTVLDCYRNSFGQPLYYEEIADRADIAPQYLLAALTELSLASYLDLTMDQRYVCTVDLSKV